MTLFILMQKDNYYEAIIEKAMFLLSVVTLVTSPFPFLGGRLGWG